jgi:hypothetical protein
MEVIDLLSTRTEAATRNAFNMGGRHLAER